MKRSIKYVLLILLITIIGTVFTGLQERYGYIECLQLGDYTRSKKLLRNLKRIR